MRARILKRVIVSASLIVVLGACASDPDDSSETTSNAITASVKEWVVAADATTAKAGEVVFTVTNNGTIGHEFLVVKTDIALGKIPLDGDHFAEPTDGIEVIDEIGEFKTGTTQTLTLNLSEGAYQLVCNLPAHYGSGMHLGFTVID